jgi:ubiquinone biosynthesis protein UbiJ
MAPSLLYSGLFAGAEFALNQLLNVDPLLKQQLQDLNGLVLEIQCRQPDICCVISIQNGRHPVRLSQAADPHPDVRISGSLPALLALLGPGGSKSLYGKNVEVQGDMARARQLQSVLSAANIDWEYHLGRVIGDVPTQTLSELGRKGADTIRQSRDSLMMNLDDYIHEEKRLLPGKAELESFYRGISDLSLRADRLRARVTRSRMKDER